jgi:hypothetical protein
MPIHIEPYDSLGLTVFRGSGDVSFKDITDSLYEFYESVDADPTPKALWDFKKANLDQVSEENLALLPRLVSRKVEKRRGGKTAIVTSRETDHALVQLLVIYCKYLPIAILGFKSRARALAWLEVDDSDIQLFGRDEKT